MRAFQTRRGLRPDGVCDAQTWAALVEAGYRLGDRPLYLGHPMLRGDDVAALQRQLGGLGFDAGRVDGIFGPRTERALADFQRNAGLVVDSICGPATIQALGRLGSRGERAEPVAGVREREALRRGPRTLEGRIVAVGEAGGLDALVRRVARVVAAGGAKVTLIQHPEGSEQAAQANAAGAEVYVGLALEPDDAACSTAYYAAHGWASPGGRRLAELLQQALPSVLNAKDSGIRGMAVPALRETRMPAVVCELAPASAVVQRGSEVADALAAALATWVAEAGRL